MTLRLILLLMLIIYIIIIIIKVRILFFLFYRRLYKKQRMPSKFKCLARRLFVVLSCIHITIDWLTNYILYN